MSVPVGGLPEKVYFERRKNLPSLVRSVFARTAFLSVALLAYSGTTHAQLVRRGGEFLINSVTQRNQRDVHLAGLPDGGFVVMWQNGDDVVARRFDAALQPSGPEEFVNTTPPGAVPYPSVAAAPDGSLFFAWNVFMPEMNASGVVGRRFDSTGIPGGPEFDIAEYSYGSLAVVASGTEEFVVVWTDASTYGGYARVVGPETIGEVFAMRDRDSQYDFAAARASDGSYRVVWYNEPSVEMQGRIFNGDQPLGDPFTVDQVRSGSHQGPAICTHDDGGFVVAWETYAPRGDDRVHYRAFAASGVPLTPPTFVTPDETNFPLQGVPVIACGLDSEFLVAWTEYVSPDGTQIIGQSFNREGPLSSRFVIGLNGEFGGDEAVVQLVGGDVLVAWTDCAEPYGCDVFGQAFAHAPPIDLPSDCNRDGVVGVDELVRAVRIALGSGAILSAPEMKNCLPADLNLDYVVTIDELVLAVAVNVGG